MDQGKNYKPEYFDTKAVTSKAPDYNTDKTTEGWTSCRPTTLPKMAGFLDEPHVPPCGPASMYERCTQVCPSLLDLSVAFNVAKPFFLKRPSCGLSDAPSPGFLRCWTLLTSVIFPLTSSC